METRAQFSKLDQQKQIAYGEVYIPDVPDSHGDFMLAGEIEKMAHRFLSKGRVDRIDVEHDLEETGVVVVESFVARPGDPDFIEGSWVVAVRMTDSLWKKVQDGVINGFSMYGTGSVEAKMLEIEIPDDGEVFGKTADAGKDKHIHFFKVKFTPQGKFAGGETGPADNVPGAHIHRISSGTATEAGGADGHTHRFSFLDAMDKTGEPLQ